MDGVQYIKSGSLNRRDAEKYIAETLRTSAEIAEKLDVKRA
jgi:hypothetical protein